MLIVDDEPAAIANLREVIASFDGLEIVAEVGDGRAAIARDPGTPPDLVFLDIEMSEVDGFEVAAATADLNYQLVFVTAYDQYALDAFATNAIDYLLKPVRPSVLEKCIRKILFQEGLVLEALNKDQPEREALVLSDGRSRRVLEPSHICFVEGIGRYRRIHLNASGVERHRVPTIISDTTLDEFEARLPASGFSRLHRSYIVNLRHIVELGIQSRRHFVTLADPSHKVPVARSKVATLRAYCSRRETEDEIAGATVAAAVAVAGRDVQVPVGTHHHLAEPPVAVVAAQVGLRARHVAVVVERDGGAGARRRHRSRAPR